MSESGVVAGRDGHRIGIVKAARLRGVGRVVATGFLAATAGGVLAGIPARLLMRVVAIAAREPAHFSWTGSIGITVVFAVAALPGALVAAATRRANRWLPSAAGAAVLCIPATGVAAAELGSTSGYSLLRWTEVGSAGAGVYLCIGALPFITLRLVDARAAASTSTPARTAGASS